MGTEGGWRQIAAPSERGPDTTTKATPNDRNEPRTIARPECVVSMGGAEVTTRERVAQCAGRTTKSGARSPKGHR